MNWRPLVRSTLAAELCTVALRAQFFWDFRNASLRTYWVDTVIKGPFGLGAAGGFIDGFFCDDIDGLGDEHPTAAANMNLTDAEVGDIQNATQWLWASTLTDTILASGHYFWNAFPGAGRAMPLPDGPKQATCAADMRGMCARSQSAAITMQMDPANAAQTVAAFLVGRTPYSWIGWGWQGCSIPPWPPQFDLDTGGPTGNCTEGPAGVFSRPFQRGVAALDCNTWTASLPF